ncbi:MBL fold metallo-hydrolase [Ruminococcaceae bacterium OttesenSCG-928-I18]|nr:MBL fold metallo-hydrolase [Ruminococcaceae bacterium OttesenSCG-928-I18]
MTELIRIPVGIVNCYLLRLGHTSVLVDCANPGSEEKIVEALGRHGLAPDNLRMILLTHNHPDHSGTAAWFREHYGLPIAMHPEDIVVGPLKQEGLGGLILGAGTKLVMGGTHEVLPDIALEGGQSLKEYGIPADVLHLPGHTAGSVGLLLDGRRLVCGDLYMNFVGPHLAYIAEDFDRMRNSERKLLARPVDIVFPGHGRPFRFARVTEEAEGRARTKMPLKHPKQADCMDCPNTQGKP